MSDVSEEGRVKVLVIKNKNMTVLEISLFNLLPFSICTVHYPAAERLFTVDKQLYIELSISYISGHLVALAQAVNPSESA